MEGKYMGEDNKKTEELLNKVCIQLEKSRIGDYVDLMQNPYRMIALNFFSGVARGFGIAFGFAILGAFVIYLLQKLVVLNLPIIGGFVAEVVKLVQLNIK